MPSLWRTLKFYIIGDILERTISVNARRDGSQKIVSGTSKSKKPKPKVEISVWVGEGH